MRPSFVLLFSFNNSGGTDRIGYERISLHWPHNTKENRVEKKKKERERTHGEKRRDKTAEWLFFFSFLRELIALEYANEWSFSLSLKQIQGSSSLSVAKRRTGHAEKKRERNKFNGRPSTTTPSTIFLIGFFFFQMSKMNRFLIDFTTKRKKRQKKKKRREKWEPK